MADAAQVRAVEANFVDAWWELTRLAGGRMHEEAGIRWFAAGDHPILNAVIETSADEPPDDGTIDRIAAALEESGSCVWWVLPGAEGTGLDGRLARAGFETWGDPWPGMAVSLANLIAAPSVGGLTLERVDDEQALDDYLAVFAATLSPGPAFDGAMRRAAIVTGFDQDAPMAHFVVRERGDAVGCASLIVAGGSAGIYNVGTLEPARGRGIGAWVTTAALEDGRRRGLEIGALQASKLGYRVYERLGFREVCRFTPWIRRRGR